MVGLLSILLFAVALLIAVGWGFITKWKYVVARTIAVVLCAGAALFVVLGIKEAKFGAITPEMIDWLSANVGEVGVELVNLLENSPVLQDAILGFGGSLVSPLLFTVLFFTFSLVSWILTAIISLILALIFHGRRRSRHPFLIIGLSFLQVFITFGVIMVPIISYRDCLAPVADVVFESGILEENDVLPFEMSQDEIKKDLDMANSIPLVNIYSNLGVKAFGEMLTSFEISGEKTSLGKEIGGIAKLGMNIVKLAESEIADYGEDQAEIIDQLSQGFTESKLLSALAGEVIYSATDAWMDESGDHTFLGVKKPEMTGTAEIFAEPFDHVIIALHTDAKAPSALSADFTTIAKLVRILAEDGIFGAIGNTDSEFIFKHFVNSDENGTSIVEKLVVTLGENNSFKILISDITNIGMRAIGSALNIPEDAETVYAQFTNEIADAVNELKAGNLTEAAQNAELAGVIKEAFANSGNDLNLEDSILELYAAAILEDLSAYETVTGDDVAEFFRAFAEASGNGEENEDSKSASSALSAVSVTGKTPAYRNPLYADKDADALKTTAAGKLAEKLQDLAADGETTESNAKKLRDAIEATAGMRSAKALYDVSSERGTAIVTVEDITVNAEEKSELLNTKELIEAEGKAIKDIISSAEDLLDQFNDTEKEASITSITQCLGKMLDAFSETVSIGPDVTSKFVVAVFQSKMVRDTVKLDMTTSVQLAKAATESTDGNRVSYANTMESMAVGATIAEKLSSENGSIDKEDVDQLISNMTPQSANMLKVYISEDRVKDFGVPEDNEKVEFTTGLMNNLFTEMGNKPEDEEKYASEVEGVHNLFVLVSNAQENTEATGGLFNRKDETDPDAETEKGRIDATADELVASIVESDMVSNALLTSMNEKEEDMVDPFGLNLSPESDDYNDCKNALENYYEENKEENPEVKDRLAAIASLLGISDVNFGD